MSLNGPSVVKTFTKYLKNDHEGFRSYKARIASLLNDLKNELLCTPIHEESLKINLF